MKNHRWTKKLERIAAEASSVLADYGLPNKYEELVKQASDSGDRLVLNAKLIVYGIHWLNEEVERGNINKALDRLLSIFEAYDEFWLLRNVPEHDRKLVETQSHVNDIRRGIKIHKSSQLGHKIIHGTEEEKNERWREYQLECEKLHHKNPALGITDIREDLAKRFGVSFKSIQRHTKKTW